MHTMTCATNEQILFTDIDSNLGVQIIPGGHSSVLHSVFSVFVFIPSRLLLLQGFPP